MLARLLAASAVWGALCATALAADLPSYKAPPPPPAFSWTGFYIGVNAGYAWGYDPVTDLDDYYSYGTTNTVVPNGGTGGGQIGFNWQFTPFIVAGVEAEGGYMGVQGTQSWTGAVNPWDGVAGVKGGAYGAVTGRFGFTEDRWMYYAKAGVVFGGLEVSYSDPGLVGGGVSNQVHVGWTVGGGIEWALTPNWSVKAEYDFYDFGKTTNYGIYNGYDSDGEAAVGVGEPYGFQHALVASKAVVGVNYRFDFLAPPTPVVATY